MDLQTKFIYNSTEYIINDCPLTPRPEHVINTDITGKTEDGSLVGRPRFTLPLRSIIMNFRAISREDRDTLVDLETIVGTYTWFSWVYNIQSNYSIDCKFNSPIKFEAIAGGFWNASLDLIVGDGNYA